MSTSLSTANVRAQIPPAGRRLFRIWQQLPTGPVSESEMNAAIIKAGNVYEGDLAAAQALRSSLVLADAVSARGGDDGQLLYERSSEFPIHAPNHPGSESFNRELARISEREHEQHAERDRAVQAALENGSFGQQRRETVALIRETVEEMFEEKVAELLRGLDREYVEELRERLRKKVAA
jgi:hypothetical protein